MPSRCVGRKMYGGQSTPPAHQGEHVRRYAHHLCPVHRFSAGYDRWPSSIRQATGGLRPVHAYASLDTNGVLYAVVYFLLIIAFSYFYAAIQYNPIEIANNLKKNGGYIPGFRPGKPTAEFIQKVHSQDHALRRPVSGRRRNCCRLSSRQHLPAITSLAIGGTSVIIVVGVALETVEGARGSDDDAALQGLP